MSPGRTPRAAGWLLAGALVLGSVAGCAHKRVGEPVAGPAQTADASIERGRKVFDQHCYKCHTQGEGGMGPVINDKPLPRFLMRFQVRHGLGVMPAFPRERISDAEVEDLLDYMVHLRRRARS